jgi:hypothetical protein
MTPFHCFSRYLWFMSCHLLSFVSNFSFHVWVRLMGLRAGLYMNCGLLLYDSLILSSSRSNLDFLNVMTPYSGINAFLL